ncbi:hypothetical protein [Streptomyces sp. NPDC004763]
MLIYGYDLGGPEEWKLEGLGEWGALPPLAWLDDDQDDEDEPLLRANQVPQHVQEPWAPMIVCWCYGVLVRGTAVRGCRHGTRRRSGENGRPL